MPKISLAAAVNLYEEDKEIRENLKLMDSPESDPHWDDWFKYALSIEPSIEEKIAVDETILKTFCSDIIEKSTLDFLRRDTTTRSNRRRKTFKAKRSLLSKKNTAVKNYDKRAEEPICYIHMVNGQKVLLRTHPCVRANRLVKRASKLECNA